MSDPQMISGASDKAIADWLEAQLRASLEAATGQVAITVPGGSTPFPILAELAARSLDWQRVAVWPGDERIVAERDPASNMGRIRSALAGTCAQIVPLEETSRPPHFVLAWLGMGGDGHIASLFPSSDPRADDPLTLRRLTPDPLPPEAPYERLTLTIPALLASDALLFVIRGEAKRALFEEAAAGQNDLPVARLLRAARQPVKCFT